jgi:ribosomal protein L11 methyltransferase
MPRTVRFSTHRDQIEQAEETLWALGAHAVTLCDPGGQPLLEPGPGETPLWEQARVEALLPDELDTEPVLRALAENGIAASPGEAELSDVPDRDWERAWMDRFEPMRFGESIWICPWHVEPDPAWPVVVRLDPGLAFGTGTHATTALCLEWLDAHDLAGRRVIDYGCGSGVLAIAAALKGAARVLAIDHDPQALDATRDNAQRNGVADRIEAVLPEAGVEQAADVVVANILASPLIELAPMLAAFLRPGGRLVLSGILTEQAEVVEAAYLTRLRPAGRGEREGWVRLDFRSRPPKRSA